MKGKLSWSVVAAAVVMLGGSYFGEALKPTVSLADIKPKLVLDALIPVEFGKWKEDPALRPVLPDPTVQAVLDTAYTQTLARVYRDASGRVVMLSVAYGKDQNSEATAAHRPEFCYTGQGFSVKDIGMRQMLAGTAPLNVRHLVGTRGNYVEQISYWVTLDETATLPGIGRKIAQIQYGLKGQIADGMLVRVSSPGTDPEEAFKLHDEFVRDLRKQLPDGMKARFMGKAPVDL